jgi:hypothetical protein
VSVVGSVSTPDLLYARQQMALSLGWRRLACLLLLARRGDLASADLVRKDVVSE